jgi:hypothetical protein
LYPLNRGQLGNLAYFFEFDYADGREPAEYARALAEEIERWPEWTSKNRPRLDLFQTDSVVLLRDSRACAAKATSVLTGLAAKLYLACDTAQTPASLARKLDSSVSELEIRAQLEAFCESRLMAEMDGRYLSLAVFRNRAASAAASVRSVDIHSPLSIMS